MVVPDDDCGLHHRQSRQVHLVGGWIRGGRPKITRKVVENFRPLLQGYVHSIASDHLLDGGVPVFPALPRRFDDHGQIMTALAFARDCVPIGPSRQIGDLGCSRARHQEDTTDKQQTRFLMLRAFLLRQDEFQLHTRNAYSPKLICSDKSSDASTGRRRAQENVTQGAVLLGHVEAPDEETAIKQEGHQAFRGRAGALRTRTASTPTCIHRQRRAA
jgi:hypothetical protein